MYDIKYLINCHNPALPVNVVFPVKKIIFYLRMFYVAV